MRIGVFGGTFDPPHIGHLIVSQEVCAALSLDRLLLVPAASPPHKRDRAVSPPDVRRRMLEAAIAGNDRFEISDLELRREGPSYTVDTLRTLRETHAGPLFLVMGADQYGELPTWREPDEIRRLADIVVLSRAGLDVDDDGARYIRVTRIDVSSSEVRRRRRDGEPIRYLVPDAVRDIIEREGLYR